MIWDPSGITVNSKELSDVGGPHDFGQSLDDKSAEPSLNLPRGRRHLPALTAQRRCQAAEFADKSGHGGRRSRARLAITADIRPVMTPINAIRLPSTAATQRAVPPWTTNTPTGVELPARTLATVITVPPSAIR